MQWRSNSNIVVAVTVTVIVVETDDDEATHSMGIQGRSWCLVFTPQPQCRKNVQATPEQGPYEE